MTAHEKAMIELYQQGQRKFYVTNERPNVDVGQVLDLTAYKSKIPFKAKVVSLGYKSAGKVWEYTLEVVGLKAEHTDNGRNKGE